MIFKELPVKVTKDLIRDPLPTTWTDDPIMPPKYDKETITSKYITPSNVDDYASSVRETKEWQILQFHPAFMPSRDVTLARLQDYWKALDPEPIYTKPNGQITNHITNSDNSSRQWVNNHGLRARGGRQIRQSQHHGHNHLANPNQLTSTRQGPAKRGWDQAGHRDTEQAEGERNFAGKKRKMDSPEPGEVCETDDQEPTSVTRSVSSRWNEDHHQPRRRDKDSPSEALKDSRVAPPDPKFESITHRSSQPVSSTPPPRSADFESNVSGKQDSGGQSSKSSSAMASPMSPITRGLLGISSDGDSDTEVSPRPRKRPAKLDVAYS